MTPHYPTSWKTSLLDDVCVRGSGHTPSKKHPEYWDGGIKWVSLADCDSLDRVYIADTKKNISELGLANSSARMHAKGTVVMSRDAGVGKSAILANDMAVSQHFIAWECSSKGIIDHRFLYQWLQHNKRRFEIIACGSTIPTIGMPYFSGLEISYPPIEQQRAISELLTELDCICLATEQLICTKEQRRQALAQRLLTGKARLPGFVKQQGTAPTHPYPLPKDWAYVRIGKVCRELTGRNSDAADLPVLSCTKHQGLVSSLDYFGKRVFSEETSAYKLVPRGTFAYATNHIEEGSIGYQDLYDLALISPIYTVFQATEQVDDSFLFRLLKTEWYRQLFQKHTNASVDRRGSLRWSHFAEIRIPLPSIGEQRAIVEVLEDADREIALHRAELDALKRQKRGLMQQLLTGKVRVP